MGTRQSIDFFEQSAHLLPILFQASRFPGWACYFGLFLAFGGPV